MSRKNQKQGQGLQDTPSRIRPAIRPVLAAVVATAWAALALGSSSSLSAQTRDYGAGFSVGAVHIGSLNSGAARPGGTPTELEPGTSFAFGMHLDHWYDSARRQGIRFQGSYQQPQVAWISGTRDINVLAADVSFLLRPLAPEPDDTAVPYITVGVGGIWYDLGRGPQTTFDPADAYYDGSSRVMPAVRGGLGIDLRLPSRLNWAGNPIWLRLEAADELIFDSPFKQLSEQSRYGAVHHFRLTLGAYSEVSLLGD